MDYNGDRQVSIMASVIWLDKIAIPSFYTEFAMEAPNADVKVALGDR